jgi:hypothetical protein
MVSRKFYQLGGFFKVIRTAALLVCVDLDLIFTVIVDLRPLVIQRLASRSAYILMWSLFVTPGILWHHYIRHDINYYF